MIYRGNHVVENTPCISLLDRGVDLDHQVSHVAEHKIHHDVDVVLILVEVIELCYARMIQALHYFFLAVNGIKFLWLKFLLFIDLDCNIRAGFFVVRLVNVRLTALADYFFYVVTILKRHYRCRFYHLACFYFSHWGRVNCHLIYRIRTARQN